MESTMKEDDHSLKIYKLSEQLMDGLAQVNKLYNTEHGFIGLLIRGPTLGNIDVLHNCEDPKDIIKILQLTIDQLKKE